MYIHLKSTPARSLLAGAVLAALSLYLLLDPGDPAAASVPMRVLAVNVLKAQSVPTYTVAHSYVGRIESARRSELAFEVPGMLSRIVPEEGDTIEVGALLATLDTERLRARRAALEESGAE